MLSFNSQLCDPKDESGQSRRNASHGLKWGKEYDLFPTLQMLRHQFILQRENGLAGAWITLSPTPAKELAVNASGFMALSREDVQTT